MSRKNRFIFEVNVVHFIYNSKQKRYKAEHGNDAYQDNRRNCGRNQITVKKSDFIKHINKRFFEEE